MPLKKTIDDMDAKGKRVLMRVDFNVPIKNGEIQDDFRIRSALPSINKILAAGGKLVLASHLGRPAEKGYEEAFSLSPVRQRLESLLGKPVAWAPDCMNATEQVAALQDGQVLLLENLRFYPNEGAKKEEDRLPLARQLASYCDIYVSDAFGTAHRDAASMTGVPKALGAGYAGLLMQKEIEYFHRALDAPERPLVAVIGGAKVSDKILLLKNMVAKCDAMLIGGAMAYTFLHAMGQPTGSSLCEKIAKDSKGNEVDIVKLALEILEAAKARGVAVHLPSDHAVAEKFGPAEGPVTVVETIPAGLMALDIGPKTIAKYVEVLASSKTVIWNGPMGAFEQRGFEAGTFAVVKALAENKGCISIVGGGDSASAAEKSGLAAQLSHISTGGGASLELLEGKTLPGVAILTDK
eukprot:TRINITY_DN44704_c0_g1_i1.p1 TRINITY_DN44704_c0_g1~~TRINITY_DN44704_c0_g1_i1.p1  ORF type:complete len:432 (-),score=101.33 TRINITY_DN44704_c0_g1_i1:194-1420(-)